MAAPWRQVPIILGLLLMLTYLLLQSRSPDLALRARMNEMFDAIELHNAELDRGVLLARAGLLLSYDSLAAASRNLARSTGALRQAIRAASAEAARSLAPQAAGLEAAAQEKRTVVEYFKSDNALLRNSLAYVVQATEALRAEASVAEERSVAAEVDALATLLLRFIQTPEPALGNRIERQLDRLPGIPRLRSDLQTLAAHGRLIVPLLSRVDSELRQVTQQSRTTAQVRSLREATLAHYSRVEARAQIYRFLLYGLAVLLLGYLGYLLVRLQVGARTLRRVNEDLRQEMADHRRSQSALLTSEEHLRAITESASEAIVSVDAEGTIVSWNAGATAMFGYPPEEALGAPFAALVPARHRDPWARQLAHRCTTDDSRPNAPAMESSGLRKTGEEFPLEVSLSSWRTAQGLFVTGIVRDLTERKRLEEKTRQQELQLIQASKMTALGTLVSGVAHEINNPNQLVLLNARLLGDVWSDAAAMLDEQAREQGDFSLGGLPFREMQATVPTLLDDMRDSALRIQAIVANLKDFARPGAPGAPAEFGLNDAVSRAARLLAHAINQKTTRFRLSLADALPLVKGDRQQIEQVIVNLVANAIEALPDPCRGISVVTGWQADACCVVLEVRDEGAGIPAEHLTRLCDPFFTTKSGSGGTGLGLAIASELVRAHGGQLTFESEPGRGTLARVALPVATPAPSVSASACA